MKWNLMVWNSIFLLLFILLVFLLLKKNVILSVFHMLILFNI